MISWIQRTFQRHFKIVFLLLLAAMVIPLVFIYSASGGFGSGDRGGRELRLFGVTLSSGASQNRITDEGFQSLRLRVANPYLSPDNEFVQRYGYERAAARQLADSLHIPQPTQDQLREYIQTLGAFAGPDGKFDAQQYSRFRDDLMASRGGQEAYFFRLMTDDWRVEQVNRALSGPGYVLDAETKEMVARADTKWSVQSATLDLTKVQPGHEPTEEELRQWFEATTSSRRQPVSMADGKTTPAGESFEGEGDANRSRYSVPERTRVNYVQYDAAAFLGQVKLTDEQIVSFFEANKSRYRQPAPPPAEGQPAAPPADPALADVRDQVVRDLTQRRAAALASEAGVQLKLDMLNGNIAPGTAAFDQLVAARGLQIQTPAPFDRNTPPAGTNWGPQVLAEAARLNAKNPVSDPLSVGDDTVLLFFQERLPSYVPEFSAVREQVAADVRQDLRMKAITARGEELRRQLGAAVASGQGFADAARAAGLEPRSWEGFTLAAPPPDLDPSVRSRIQDLPLGDVSPMAVAGDRGTFVLVTGRQVPEVSTTDEAFAGRRSVIMEQASGLTSSGILSDLVEKEFAAAGLSAPAQ